MTAHSRELINRTDSWVLLYSTDAGCQGTYIPVGRDEGYADEFASFQVLS